MEARHDRVSSRIFKSFAANPWALWFTLTCAFPAVAAAQATPTVEGKAPEKTVVLRHQRGGAWYVSEPLKEQYDKLLARVGALRADLDSERITGADAQRELDALQLELSQLRDRIEKEKVLVSPVKVHQQKETTEFEPGPSRMLVITADNLRVEGWAGPKVKVVLDKTVLSPDDNPVDAQLQGLRIVHHFGRAPELVGKSAAERAADDERYYATAEGAKLTPGQRETRRKWGDEIADGYARYHDFQGKEFDTVEIEGLTYEQGNRQISVHITSPGGGASSGGDWQRHAALTVYVPRSDAVALRGCLVNLDVKGVHAPLLVTRDGSLDRDYDGTFSIRDAFGPVTADNAPLDLIDTVHGDLKVTDTMELVNTGTTHEDGERVCYTPPARALRCLNVEGDLTAWFIRGDLTLKAIGGRIDLSNEFGNTTLLTDKLLPGKAHRLVSESGRIEARLAAGAVGKLPLQALTNCGAVRTNAPQDVLETTDFSTGRDYTGAGHGWRGVKSAIKEEPGAFFEAADRLSAVLQGRDRSPGLDLVSRGGAVIVHFDK